METISLYSRKTGEEIRFEIQYSTVIDGVEYCVACEEGKDDGALIFRVEDDEYQLLDYDDPMCETIMALYNEDLGYEREDIPTPLYLDWSDEIILDIPKTLTVTDRYGNPVVLATNKNFAVSRGKVEQFVLAENEDVQLYMRISKNMNIQVVQNPRGIEKIHEAVLRLQNHPNNHRPDDDDPFGEDTIKPECALDSKGKRWYFRPAFYGDIQGVPYMIIEPQWRVDGLDLEVEPGLVYRLMEDEAGMGELRFCGDMDTIKEIRHRYFQLRIDQESDAEDDDFF